MRRFGLLCLVCILLAGMVSVALAQEGHQEVEPITANNDWAPMMQEFGGVEMVLVPPGCFMMGSTDEQIDEGFKLINALVNEDHAPREWFEREGPQHEICFDEPFWIDRYEVTNGQFADFDGVADLESEWTDDNHPRENITWFEARYFCDLRGMRLPTEAEWEYAARGPDGLIFPWGFEFDGTLLNFCDENCEFDWANEKIDDGHAFTAPVGSYVGGESWVSAYDMSGNVSEWVSTIYGVDPEGDFQFTDEGDELVLYPYDPTDGREEDSEESSYVRTKRGAGWISPEGQQRAMARGWDPPDWPDYISGLRCARDYATGE